VIGRSGRSKGDEGTAVAVEAPASAEKYCEQVQ
jgi:hypothetical protein